MDQLEINSPYDGALIKKINFHQFADVDKALDRAYKLFQDRTLWLAVDKRKQILKKLQQLMAESAEELIITAAKEGGKPYQDSKVELERAINGIEIAAENIGQLTGAEIAMNQNAASAGKMAFTQREPIGVVAAVSAFNHPINLAVHQIITAFAAGCPVIFKPDLRTPLSGLHLERLIKKAGCPDDWVQVMILNNEDAEKLVTDSRVNFFTFIGSHKVGWYLRSKLAAGTRCALEHGGAAPVIVERDADVDKLIPAIAKGGFYHAGQVCVSVQRVFVHEEIAEELAERLAKDATNMKVGDPTKADTEVGPMIGEAEVERMKMWISEAEKAGAKILCGGEAIGKTCFEPTVLYNPPHDVKVSQQEIFGPIVCVYPYKDREKAIHQANALDMHFQAAVFTKDINIAMDTVDKLNANAVMVNEHTAFRVDWMPFGGRDASGIGMGGIPYSMHEMTRTKLMVINKS
ncbi:MAG: aldehyde dehydrogenase family protein [Cyclobacteriaceae bacterium]|nr:aldehyde dehydrogenase family protein [Cyclobacteriaceae bacterium]MCH8515323.1 aldehyde dehydrogenase family protein [Cyclobacteriaceae bacterium]